MSEIEDILFFYKLRRCMSRHAAVDYATLYKLFRETKYLLESVYLMHFSSFLLKSLLCYIRMWAILKIHFCLS